MFRILLILFICIPVVEIYLFIEVGGLIGTPATIGLIILTAIIGAHMLKAQGISTLSRAQKNLDKNRIPATELVEGITLLICGAFLLTPGFFTDTVGFILLIPSSRRFFAKRIIQKYSGKIFSSFSRKFSYSNNDHEHKSSSGETIDGEYTKEVDNNIEIDHKK